jgi:hypothetical protein
MRPILQGQVPEAADAGDEDKVAPALGVPASPPSVIAN